PRVQQPRVRVGQGGDDRPPVGPVRVVFHSVMLATTSRPPTSTVASAPPRLLPHAGPPLRTSIADRAVSIRSSHAPRAGSGAEVVPAGPEPTAPGGYLVDE